jgi:hypothetical protein
VFLLRDVLWCSSHWALVILVCAAVLASSALALELFDRLNIDLQRLACLELRRVPRGAAYSGQGIQAMTADRPADHAVPEADRPE